MIYIMIPILVLLFYSMYCLCVVAKRADEEMEQLMAVRIAELKKSKKNEN